MQNVPPPANRGFSFPRSTVVAIVIACICTSIAAGQEPPTKSPIDGKRVLIEGQDFDDMFRPHRPIPANGIDVPKLIDGQRQPQQVGWPKLNCYLLIVAESDLTDSQRDAIKWLFHRGALVDGFAQIDANQALNQAEAKRFLDMVAAEDAKRQTTFGMLRPYLVGGMIGAAFVLVMWVCQDWFRWQSYRDQGLVK